MSRRLGASPGPPTGCSRRSQTTHSWERQKSKGRKGEPWDGVRNFMARNNMVAMQLGDLGFFYHSGEGKEIVGIVEVCATAHPDPRTTPACGSASTCVPSAMCRAP